MKSLSQEAGISYNPLILHLETTQRVGSSKPIQMACWSSWTLRTQSVRRIPLTSTQRKKQLSGTEHTFFNPRLQCPIHCDTISIDKQSVRLPATALSSVTFNCVKIQHTLGGVAAGQGPGHGPRSRSARASRALPAALNRSRAPTAPRGAGRPLVRVPAQRERQPPAWFNIAIYRHRRTIRRYRCSARIQMAPAACMVQSVQTPPDPNLGWPTVEGRRQSRGGPRSNTLSTRV
jgi:hypothetical protein